MSSSMEVSVQTPLEPPSFPFKISTNGRLNTKTDDKIARISLEIAKDCVLHAVGRASSRPASTYVSNMRGLVDKILTRHDILYNGMVKKLNFAEVDVHTTCRDIADELFADGKINWGRIVALYAFVARLAKYFAERGLDSEENTNALASYLGDYVVNELQKWISEQGGWDNFLEHFPATSNNIESKFFKGLMFTGLGLGGLLAGYLVIR